MPIPAKAPMEHPIKGLSSPRDARTKTAALVYGGTSLKLSNDGDQKSACCIECSKSHAEALLMRLLCLEVYANLPVLPLPPDRSLRNFLIGRAI